MSSKRQRIAVELNGEAADVVAPSVCYLPSMQANGTVDNAGAPTLPSAAKRLKFSVHSRRGAHGGTQLVQANLGDIEFVGRSDGDENAGMQPCCYAVGVFSPAEGKLRLTAVASERLFRLDSRWAFTYPTLASKCAPCTDDMQARRGMACVLTARNYGCYLMAGYKGWCTHPRARVAMRTPVPMGRASWRPRGMSGPR